MKPTYSVCICNYNMADTLERALVSVLDQLDERYEVLVIDDGSSDNSVELLERLSKTYPSLRFIPLKRDRNRMLGETRNISIREAKGDYVLLHIDTDDLWERYIKDFVLVFHNIEKCIGRDVLLSGQQINMGRRDFLLSYGPYRNIYHVEDRDLWYRLAADDAYMPLDHKVFRARLSRPKKVSFFKAFKDVWHHILYDLRQGSGEREYIYGTFRELVAPTNNFSVKRRLMGAGMVCFAYIASRFYEPVPPPKNMRSHTLFARYREMMRGTYPDLMRRCGGDPSLAFLDPGAQKIFAAAQSVRDAELEQS